MARKSGSADLPLHGGHVPKWLADRMTRLGAVISEAIIHHYGRDELLRRLAHPFWFQSFGAVMGMDRHSSGITTSVIGALKRGLEPLASAPGRCGRWRWSPRSSTARPQRPSSSLVRDGNPHAVRRVKSKSDRWVRNHASRSRNGSSLPIWRRRANQGGNGPLAR
jgi:Protein of unknown function (DUF763)